MPASSCTFSVCDESPLQDFLFQRLSQALQILCKGNFEFAKMREGQQFVKTVVSSFEVFYKEVSARLNNCGPKKEMAGVTRKAAPAIVFKVFCCQA